MNCFAIYIKADCLEYILTGTGKIRDMDGRKIRSGLSYVEIKGKKKCIMHLAA